MEFINYTATKEMVLLRKIAAPKKCLKVFKAFEGWTLVSLILIMMVF